MRSHTYLSNVADEVLDGLYAQYRRDPAAVEPSWRHFFDGFDFGQVAAVQVNGHAAPDTISEKEIRVLRLIEGYRARGHLFTRTNPVRQRRTYPPTLDIENFGLAQSDLDATFNAGIEVGLGPAPLRDIVALLHQTYCQSIGVEYKFMLDPVTVAWLQERMESTRNAPQFSRDEKVRLLKRLTEAVGFEQFLHKKFVGQKRFSLEGAENFVPALDTVIRYGAELGICEFVIGMAHRGRLNVLANILCKSYADIFTEFYGKGFGDQVFEGDVKYHMGFSSDLAVNGGNVHLSLASNPSHLEAVDPVVEGIVRAKIDARYGGDAGQIAPLLIHGDASVAGQGVIYELIQMSQLRGYRTGGTIHIVINNQVGFTTNYIDGRSSIYCTDVAKVTRSPVFHVNGDDAEAVVLAIRMAVEFRQKFGRDVFVDLLCYRKHGHNEGDEPRFTQPLLYKLIEQHPNPRDIYRQTLKNEGSVDDATAQGLADAFEATLETAFDEARNRTGSKPGSFFAGDWAGIQLASDADFDTSPATGVPDAVLRPLAERMLALPPGQSYFRKTEKLFEERRAMVAEGTALDWAMGEWLAYASLLHEGCGVRLSGQDCGRGTFSHRHAVITLEDSEEKYIPLAHLHPDQGRFQIWNSHLAEYAVLGFELGYAMARPKDLVIWEAQFGDFANGAQIIIDQFVCCAETKWQRMNGLVLLLPHGYEGQGPEHSSARLERFLELCAGNNMQVANCTTPANLFHVLRRQMHRAFRKPLVIMTPKSGLRHPQCISPWTAFTGGGFREVIDDESAVPKKVRKVLLCSGKIYYDLHEQRVKSGCGDVAIVRLEQLYPLAATQLAAVRKRYARAKQWVWVQEEPENMGAWSFLLRKLPDWDLQVISRKENSSPATGFHAQHVSQQEYIVHTALGLRT